MGASQRPPSYDDEPEFDFAPGDDDVIEGEVVIDYVPRGGRSRTGRRQGPQRYPMVYEVRYPGAFDRVGAALRPLLAIPLVVFLIPLQVLIAAGFAVGWLAVIGTRTYPRWLFDALVGALTFAARIEAYVLLLSDYFPLPNDSRSPVAIAWADPPDGRLSPWRTGLWKTVILIPHALVVAVLTVAQAAVTAISWVAILRTGHHPPDLFAFSTGVNRWRYRVVGYWASFNDRFPPFTPWSGAGPARNETVMACAAGGLLAAGAAIGVGIAVATTPGGRAQEVDWATLESRTSLEEGWQFAAGSSSNPSFVVTLLGVVGEDDGGGRPSPLGAQSLTFLLDYENGTSAARPVEEGSIAAVVESEGGDRRVVQPAFVTVNGALAPAPVPAGGSARVEVTFVIPFDSRVRELRLAPPWSAPEVAFKFN